MTDSVWTFGGGPAERIEDRDGQFQSGQRLYIRSTVTRRYADIDVYTGFNGRIPSFELPREWEWSSVDVSVDDIDYYPLGQARELQARPATVIHLRETVAEQAATISAQAVALAVQNEQIGALLGQVAASTAGVGLPETSSPDDPDLPLPSDPSSGEDVTDLPLPTVPPALPAGDDPAALPLPEGFQP